MPTGRAGQPITSATASMDMDAEPEDQQDVPMGAQSISSGSSSRGSTSVAGTIDVDLQSLMWESVVSQQCAPMILDLLLQTEYVPQDDTKGNADHLRDLTN
eukprot:2836424-Amphidinium_carterae.1